MKNYIYKKLSIMLLLILALLIPSCTGNFDSLNLSPTNPTEDDLTESERLGALFSGLISTMHNIQENTNQHVEQMIGGQYGGYMATTNNWQGTNFGTFNPAKDWVDHPFKTVMVDFNSNFVKVMDVTESKGYIFAWASIIRAATMLRITDIYGPIPYSQIGLVDSDNIEYDDVQDIYHNMIDGLTRSVSALSSYLADNTGKSPMSKYDIVYNGDFQKWIRLANSLKLRMANRIAHVDSQYAIKAIQEAINDGPIEQNSDNAFIPTENNPYYKAAFDWKDLASSASLSSFMNGFNDPRLPKYLSLASGAYRGVRLGIENINKDVYSDETRYSKPLFNPTSPVLVFCAAETAFLKSEAALRGWIPGGDNLANSFYEEGIRLSMEQHGVQIGDYLDRKTVPQPYTDPRTGKSVNVANKITVSWSDSGSTTNSKLEKIITQKWIAIYPLGLEAWAEHRRTGFPQLFPADKNLSSSGFIGTITNTSSRMARRLPYPQSQYQGNGVNVEKAVLMLKGDDTASTDLWWAKKP